MADPNNILGIDPSILPLLGAAASMGAASAPSRLPVPTGMILGAGAGGLAQGMNNQAALQMLGPRYRQENAAANMAEAEQDYWGIPQFLQQYRQQQNQNPSGTMPNGNPPGQPSSTGSTPPTQVLGSNAGANQVAGPGAPQPLLGGAAAGLFGNPGFLGKMGVPVPQASKDLWYLQNMTQPGSPERQVATAGLMKDLGGWFTFSRNGWGVNNLTGETVHYPAMPEGATAIRNADGSFTAMKIPGVTDVISANSIAGQAGPKQTKGIENYLATGGLGMSDAQGNLKSSNTGNITQTNLPPPPPMTGVPAAGGQVTPKQAPFIMAVDAAADKYGVPRYVAEGLIESESRANPNVPDSKKGAQGIMQIKPATGVDLGVNPRNAFDAIDKGVGYLRQQYDQFGSWPGALAAYNWGQGNVKMSPNPQAWPASTRNYVQRIMGNASGASDQQQIPQSTQPTQIAQNSGPPIAGAAPQHAPQANTPQPGQPQGADDIPPVSMQSKIFGGEEYLKKKQGDWADQENAWTGSIADLRTAEQRVMAIGDAFKRTQSGPFAEQKAQIKATLDSAGIHLPEETFGNPAAVQEALKNAFASVVPMIRAFTSRPTASELNLGLGNFANPHLQPEANLQILSETLGGIHSTQQMINSWAKAKNNGWVDPQNYEQAWSQMHPLQPFIDSAASQIGPLKGMPGASGQPQYQEGHTLYNKQTGQTAIFTNGKWVITGGQ